MKEIDEINDAQNEVFLSHFQSRNWEKLLNYVKTDEETIQKNSTLIQNSISIRKNDNTLFSLNKKFNKIIFAPKLGFILHIIRIIDFDKVNFLDLLFHQIMEKIEKLNKSQIKQFIESFPESRFFPLLEPVINNFDFLYSLIDVYPKKMVEYLPQLIEMKRLYLIHRLYDYDNTLTDKFPEIFLDVLKSKCLNFAQIQNFTKNFNTNLKKRVNTILETKKKEYFSQISPFNKSSLLKLEKKAYGWFDHVFLVMTDEEIEDIVSNALQIPHYHSYSNEINYNDVIHSILISIVWNGKGHLLIPRFDKILEYNHRQPVSDCLRRNPDKIAKITDIPALIMKLGYFSNVFLSEKFLNLIDYNINVFSAFLKANIHYWQILKFFKQNFPVNKDEYDKEILKLYKDFDFSLENDYETCISFFLYSYSYYANKQYFPYISKKLLESKVKKYLLFLPTQKKKMPLNLLNSQLIYDRFTDFSIKIQKRIIDSFSFRNETFFIHLVTNKKLSNQIVSKILKLLKFKDNKNYGANNQIFIILKCFLKEYSLSEKQTDVIIKLLKQSPDQPLKAQIYSYLGKYRKAVEVWERILPKNYIRKWFLSQKVSYLGDLMNLEPVFSLIKKKNYLSTLKSLDSEFHLLPEITSQESSSFRFKFSFLQIKASMYYFLNELSSRRKIQNNSCFREILNSIELLKNKNIPEAEIKYLLFLHEFVDILKNTQNKDFDDILSYIKENVQTMDISNEKDLRYNQFLNRIKNYNSIHEFSSFKFSNPVNFCPVNSVIKEIIFYQKKVIDSSGTEEKELVWKFSNKKSQFILNIPEEFKTIHVSVITEKPTFEKPIISYPTSNPLIEIRHQNENINENDPEKNGATEFYYKFYIRGDKFNNLVPIKFKFKESDLCGLTIDSNLLLKHESSEINPDEFVLLFGKYSGLIEDLSNKFCQYNNLMGNNFNKLHIENWLHQFESADEAKLMIPILENINFYGKYRIVKIFEELLKKNFKEDDYRNIIFANLGIPYDSSFLITYCLGDFGMPFNIPALSIYNILELLNIKEKKVIFIDDNIGTGKQIVSIFKSFIGIPHPELKENRNLELTETNKEKLKEIQFYIMNCFGLTIGKDKIMKEVKDLGLNLKDVIFYKEIAPNKGIFHETSNIFSSKQEREQARDLCQKISKELLSEYSDDQEKLSNRLLGYGNHGLLNVFFYNVPSTTLTILWKEGKYQDKNWFALFPRRKKEI